MGDLRGKGMLFVFEFPDGLLRVQWRPGSGVQGVGGGAGKPEMNGCGELLLWSYSNLTSVRVWLDNLWKLTQVLWAALLNPVQPTLISQHSSFSFLFMPRP